MMDNLFKKVIGGFVKSSFGDAKELSYKGATVKGIPEYIELETDEKDTIQSKIVFHGVELDTEPKYGDVILYKSQKWSVENHTDNYGLYDITAVIKKTQRGRR